MDPKRIRDQSIREARQFDVVVPATLPLFDPELRMRSRDEVVSRILAMNAVAAAAYGFDKAKAIEWLKEEVLTDSLSESERVFMIEGRGQPERFQLQVEGMWALAWAMGIVNDMNFGKNCDDRFAAMLPNLKVCEHSADFCRKATPRPLEQIVAACDLAYCLHWGIRQRELTNRQPPDGLKPNIIIERRRALEWLLGDVAWDEVPLDT